MTEITDKSTIEALYSGDCAPIFESIIATKYIASIWSFSSENSTVFDMTINRQFVGVMHAGTQYETTWTEESCGWIEDGSARKGEVVVQKFYTEFSEALDALVEETKRLIALEYGSLSAEDLSV